MPVLSRKKTYLGLFQYAVPEAETFNLLGDQKEGDSSGGGKEKKKVDRSNPVTHLRSRILLSTMTEQVIKALQVCKRLNQLNMKK